MPSGLRLSAALALQQVRTRTPGVQSLAISGWFHKWPALWAAFVAIVFAALPVRAETQVDLELVLAVDVSMSMDVVEQKNQRQGYVAAFRSDEIVRAIQQGVTGRIGVTYVEWAGAGVQQVVVPWSVVSDAASADAFAKRLNAQPITRARMTSISGALLMSAALFEANTLKGYRRVIDVSGDGPNNGGAFVDDARNRVVKQGITINGLPFQFPRPEGVYSYFDLPDLDKYYAGCVIGGPGAFMIAVKEPSKFAEAIKRKLLLEIADLKPVTPPKFIRSQFRVEGPRPSYDCKIGEKRWEQYQLEQW